MATLQTFKVGGWAEINLEGLSTVYLAIVDEGYMTGAADTPANTQYKPRIRNPENFSIKRSPPVWPQQSTSVQGAAFGQLEIDNYDGAFDFLLSSDLRDSTLILNLVTATAFEGGASTAARDGFLMATGVLDEVRSDNEDVITLSFKDTLARLDRTLPCRYNPPFVDPNAANTMIPVVLGAFRNVAPQLVDSPSIRYLIGDAPIANIIQVCDKAAPLDPYSSPPQYQPAYSNCGLQLQSMPVGKLTCSGNSVGQQANIPGIQDVLAGAGAFPDFWNGFMTGGGNTTLTSIPVIFGADYRFNVSVVTGFAPGQTVFVSDGVNSIRGPINAVVGSNVRVTIASSTTTGTPTSITNGSPVLTVGAPTGFVWSNGAGSTIGEVKNPPNVYLGSTNGASLFTGNVWNPGTTYGDQLSTATAILQPGMSYRVSFSLYSVQSCQPFFSNGFQGGLIVATALSSNAADYVTGMNQPLTTTQAFQGQNFTFEFTVPAGAARKLYFIAVPSSGNAPGNAQGNVVLQLYNIKLEQLGQFAAALPLSGISLTDYFTEILVNRAGEASTIFNHTDTDALAIRDVATPDGPAGSIIPFSAVFTTPPNILDALRLACDNFCIAIFTDAAGIVRARRLTDPSNPNGRVVRATFDASNVVRPIQVMEDKAVYLTTNWGCRRNWSPFTSSDFVTDQNIVSQDTKARYSRVSQYAIRTSKIPAGMYNFAIAAPQFETTIDIPNDCQLEGERVVGIWSPNQYTDGTTCTGKRRIVTFTALYDDPNAVGTTTTAAVTNIQFGDIIQFTYASHGFNGAFGAVLEWEIFPFANKIALTVMI